MMEIFLDNNYMEGFDVTGNSTDIQSIGQITIPIKKKATPKWRLAQWGCSNNILDGVIDLLSDSSYMISTESQKILVKDRSITIELKASKEYNGHVREHGEIWPHLLLEQLKIDDRCPPMEEIEELRLKFHTRLVYADFIMENPNPDLHSGQITMYFTLADMTNGDFMWFGIQCYDTRCEMLPLNYAEDDGKDDASHKFIYAPAQSNFTKIPLGSKQCITYELDMLPYLKEAYDMAKSKNYLKNSDFEKMKISSMNFGWEMAGIYDCSIKLDDLSLNAVKKLKN